jgi:hypothetical protein
MRPSNYTDEFLQAKVGQDGCCGHRENLKLRVYNLVQHPMAIHLDMDSIILKPLDELFDAMYYSFSHAKGIVARRRLNKLVAPTYKPAVPLAEMTINAFYTKDYNMAKPYLAHAVGLQGGFILVRPDIQVYERLVRLQQKAPFVRGRDANGTGWYGSSYGSHIYGSMTIQGFLSYYFGDVANSTAVELHRCKFNQMADNPRMSSHRGTPRPTPKDAKKAGFFDLNCKDGRGSKCDDVQCQTWSINDTRSAHYNFCFKPWACPNHFEGISINEETCADLHREWFRIRHSLEQTTIAANGTYHPEVYFGHCSKTGLGGYISIGESGPLLD